MRPRFRTSLICSSNNYELTIKIHRNNYADKWDILYEELNACIPYYYFLGKKIIIRNKIKRNEVIRNGFKIHFE